MTYKEILGKDFSEINKLNTKELKKVTRILADVANKRISRLQERGLQPPALRSVFDSGRTGFATKGKSRNELLSEFLSASNFLRAKGSTLQGAKKQLKTMSKQFGGDLTADQANLLWKSLDRIKQQYGTSALKQYMDSNQLVDITRRVIISGDIPGTGDQDQDIDNLVAYLSHEVDRAYYEAMQKRPKHDFRNLGKENNTTSNNTPRNSQSRNKRKRGRGSDRGNKKRN